ncbi:MAG: outer membrane lipoprotein carrier protein LolA [Spirochaetes bacterium]|nr:outer membrane lipoprotein carrier protein LolA [Spirochaetota bacterium]
MKRLRMPIIVITLLCSTALFSITGEEAVEKFSNRMRRIGKLTGVISWTSLDGQTYSGSFKYMSPDKVYVKFTSPTEKILVSNGKTLWIYSPGTNMCGIQELAKGSSSGGIVGLVAGYNGIAAGNESGYTIKLKSDDKQYREIILSVDGTYMLRGAIFKREDGRIISFSLSDVSGKADVREGLFNFKVPKGAQIVKNPMNIR